MYLLTEEALKLLLNRFRNRLATRTNLDKKVDKIDGKGLSDNDFTAVHESSLSKRLDSMSVEHSTGKSKIIIENNIKNVDLELNTGCDAFFFPLISDGIPAKEDGTITIPYTFICKEGCEIGQVTVTIDYLTSELPSVAQTFNIEEGSGNIIFTSSSNEARGDVKISFTLIGDTEDFKANMGSYNEVLLVPLMELRVHSKSFFDYHSNLKASYEPLDDGTYKATVYATSSGIKHIQFSHYGVYEVYNIYNDITNMAEAFVNCTNLTGNPVCGSNVTDMNSAYYNCRNLTGNPVCGDKVTTMYQAYEYCYNLTGSPVCGPNVTNMNSAYYYCANLTGAPVCGNNVTDMGGTYYCCYNLTGDSVCGNNVTNMYQTYFNCWNLTGAPVCGPNVTDMQWAYSNCNNITGSPVCGDKVTTMYHAYQNCRNLTGSPVCGNNVTDMIWAYAYCANLTGNPVCGPNVTNMLKTYYDCSNLTGSPVCGPNVTDMDSAYCYCLNLTGSPVCGNKVIRMDGTYFNCYNLTGSPVCGPNVTDMDSAYWNCRNLTGSPACGSKVTNMYRAYELCINLTGSPVCGNNVTDMANAYYNCTNLTGSPVCGNNVIYMGNTYWNCRNLKGSPACGSNVTVMTNAYSYCRNLTGSPACGNNVTDMRRTYYNCYNLTGNPVCGDKVTTMSQTYENCYNLTGNPACGPNVIDMCSTYMGCTNLTGSPVCGNNVTNMSYTYTGCKNLTGSPVCGNNVTDMNGTYHNCINLTGSPACGTKVTSMVLAYSNCYNLTGSSVCGNNVTNMANAYYNCKNLASANIGPNVTNTFNCYSNCFNIKSANISNGATQISNDTFKNCSNLTNITIPPSVKSIGANAFNGCSNLTSYDFTNCTNIPSLNSTTAFSGINNNCLILVPTALYGDWVIASNWSAYANYILPDSTEPGVVSIENDSIDMDINKTKTVDIMIVNFEDVNSINVSVVSDKDTCVSIGNITRVQKNPKCAIISVELISADLEEDANITLTVSSATASVDYTFVAKVEKVLVSYTVEPVDGASYGFELNANGYYESKNKGVNSSYAICKVNIVNSEGTHKVYIDCINFAESNYDYGILSNIGSTLTLSNESDTDGVKKSFKGSSMNSVQSVGYGVAEGTIYIKFRKDSSDYSGNDTLQFKVRFEPYTPGIEPTITVENVPEASYGFTLGSDGYYVNNNVDQHNTAALCRVTIDNPGGVDIIFECLQSSEYNYDYGILSKVGSTLSINSEADNSSYVQQRFYGNSSGGTVNYGPINGVIYVKYLKDSSASNGTDTFKFKVTYE